MKKFILALTLCMFIGLTACGTDKEVQAVVDKIDSISNVDLENYSEIANIQKSYDALSDEQKVKVTNYSKLESAQGEILNLVKNEMVEEVEAMRKSENLFVKFDDTLTAAAKTSPDRFQYMGIYISVLSNANIADSTWVGAHDGMEKTNGVELQAHIDELRDLTIAFQDNAEVIAQNGQNDSSKIRKEVLGKETYNAYIDYKNAYESAYKAIYDVGQYDFSSPTGTYTKNVHDTISAMDSKYQVISQKLK